MNGAVPDELARILSILGGGNTSVAAPQPLPTPPPVQRGEWLFYKRLLCSYKDSVSN